MKQTEARLSTRSFPPKITSSYTNVNTVTLETGYGDELSLVKETYGLFSEFYVGLFRLLSVYYRPVEDNILCTQEPATIKDITRVYTAFYGGVIEAPLGS